MFLVEKDSYPESKVILSTNVTNLMGASSITNLIDTDRHKFETFADALWWGIVSDNYSLIDFINLNEFFFLKSL